MTDSCCFHSYGQMPVCHIFTHSMCKTFTALGPLTITSSAGILSKPGALPECRSMILKKLFSIFLHLPGISVGLVSVMPVPLFITICLVVKVLFFTFQSFVEETSVMQGPNPKWAHILRWSVHSDQMYPLCKWHLVAKSRIRSSFQMTCTEEKE